MSDSPPVTLQTFVSLIEYMRDELLIPGPYTCIIGTRGVHADITAWGTAELREGRR